MAPLRRAVRLVAYVSLKDHTTVKPVNTGMLWGQSKIFKPIKTFKNL